MSTSDQRAPEPTEPEEPKAAKPASYALPLLFDTVPEQHRPMMQAFYEGVSVRGWVKILSWGPPALRLTKHRVEAAYEDVSTALLTEMNERLLDGVDVAAILIDGTPIGTDTPANAGTDAGQRMVLWAIGVTRDGEKIPLGVRESRSERAEVVEALLASFVERGLDIHDVLWVVDAGSGIRAAIMTATRGRAAIQQCRVHRQRNVLDTLDAATREAIGGKIVKRNKAAWAKEDYEKAKAALEENARWLEGLGHVAAAKTLREGIEPTLTLQRLGVNAGRIRIALGSTNPIESVHRMIGRWKARYSIWRSEGETHQRQRLLASVATGIQMAWTVVASRRELDGLTGAVVALRHFAGQRWVVERDDGSVMVEALPAAPDREAEIYPALRGLLRRADRLGKTVTLAPELLADAALVARIGPWIARAGFRDGVRTPQPRGAMAWSQVSSIVFALRAVPVPARDPDAAEALLGDLLGLGAERAGADAEIVCAGAANALATLGLAPGQRLSVAQLTTAAQGRDADGRPVRTPAPRQLEDALGVRTGATAQGVVDVAWELAPPQELARRWRDADPAGRAALERLLVASAEAAVGDALTADDLAVVLVVDRSDEDAGPVVRGLVLGAERDGTLVSPADQAVLPRGKALVSAHADAEDLAAGILDAELARFGTEAGLALPRPLSEPWTTADCVAVLGPRGDELVAGAGAFPALDDKSLDWVVEEREAHGDPFARLDREGAALATKFAADLAATREQLAQVADAEHVQILERRIDRLDGEIVALRRSGRHPDRWLERYGGEAVRVLALDATLASRQSAIAQDGGVGHLLERFRGVLGGRRLRQLAERAAEHQRAWSERDPGLLEQRRAELLRDIEPIDRSGPSPERRERRLDGWMQWHAERAAELVAVQALLNERAQDRDRERAVDAAPAQETAAAPAAASVEPEREPDGDGFEM